MSAPEQRFQRLHALLIRYGSLPDPHTKHEEEEWQAYVVADLNYRLEQLERQLEHLTLNFERVEPH